MTESEKMSGMQLSKDAAGGKPLEGASDMAFKAADLADVLYGGEITVLGIGNIILGDEGFGVRVAEYLDAHYDFPRGVQILDGGTLGIELTQYLTGTKKLLIIDSIDGGEVPGTRFRFENDEVFAHFSDKISAHEIGVQDVLALLTVTGRKIPEVTVLGVQPFVLEAGVSLSPAMRALVEPTAAEAVAVLKNWGVESKKKTAAKAMDYCTVAEEKMRKASVI